MIGCPGSQEVVEALGLLKADNSKEQKLAGLQIIADRCKEGTQFISNICRLKIKERLDEKKYLTFWGYVHKSRGWGRPPSADISLRTNTIYTSHTYLLLVYTLWPSILFYSILFYSGEQSTEKFIGQLNEQTSNATTGPGCRMTWLSVCWPPTTGLTASY